MRPLTAFQAALLTCRAGYTTHPRVWVRNAHGSWLNMASLLGLDWLLGVRLNDKLDAPVAEVEVSFARNGPGGRRLSLSPLVVTSLANAPGGPFRPLLAEGAYLRVELGLAPLGGVPAPGDYFEVFRGRIDEVDAGPEELKVVGRDLGGLLQDTVIEVERDYGNETVGVAVQDLIQALLNDNGLGSTFGLYTPVDPLSQRGRYTRKSEPLLDAVRTLAQKIGWDCRMKWRASAGAFALTLFAPDRLQPLEDWSYGPDEYQDLEGVTRQLADIRTDVEVVYSDKSDLDAAGNRKRKRVTASNPSARAQVGRRWMQIAEEASSNIDTEAEAQRLADAAVADLSTSPLTVSMTVLPHPGLEVGDVVRVLPDGVRLDTPQALAVQELEFQCATDGTALMKLVLRGQPSTSVREWLERDARPGIAPSAPFTGPAAPQGVKVVPIVNGFVATWTPPTSGPAWEEYELHVARTADFAPTGATFQARGRTTRFEVSSLLPGVTYYCRVVGRDAKGNVGAASAAVPVTTGYLTPATLQPSVAFGDSPPNPDFEAWSTESQPPDAWTMGAGLWGAHAQVSGDAYTGARCLRLLTNGARLDSQAMIARPGDRYTLDALAKTTFSGAVLAVQLVWYDGGFGVLATASLARALSAGSWQRMTGVYSAPTGTRYVQVRLLAGPTTGEPWIQVDSVRLERVGGIVEAWTAIRSGPISDLLNGWTAWDAGWPLGYYKNSDNEVALRGMLHPGTVGYVNAFALPAGYRSSSPRIFTVPTSTGMGFVQVNVDGGLQVFSVPAGAQWVGLDTVRFRAEL